MVIFAVAFKVMCKAKWKMTELERVSQECLAIPFVISVLMHNCPFLFPEYVHREVSLPHLVWLNCYTGGTNRVFVILDPHKQRVCGWQMTKGVDWYSTMEWKFTASKCTGNVCPPPWTALRSINPITMISILISNSTCLRSAVDGRLLTHLCHRLKH